MAQVRADKRTLGLSTQIVMAIGVAAAAWIAGLYVRNGSVDVVYADTWGYISMIDNFLSGAFDPWEMVRAHNQNRSVVLTTVLLGSALVDHFNQKNIMYLGVTFAAMTSVFVLGMAYNLLKGRVIALLLISFAIAFSLLSLISVGNLLLSINFVFFSTITFSVTAIIAMSRCIAGRDGASTWGWFLVAAVLSEAALFSMGGGVVVWLVNLVQISVAVALFRVRAAGALAFYAALGFISIGTYLWGLNAGGSPTFALAHPVDAVAFFVIGTGNSIVGFFANTPWLTLDFVVGFALIAAYAYVFIYFTRLPRDEQKRSLALICVLLLGLVEQALLVYGRLPLGVANAATARYSTLTMISPVAALVFLTVYADRSRIYFALALLTGIAVVVFAAVGDCNEWAMAPMRQAYQRNLQGLIRGYEIGSDEARQLEWDRLD